jgi:hypothetical protein
MRRTDNGKYALRFTWNDGVNTRVLHPSDGCAEVSQPLQPINNGYATVLQEGYLLEW